MERLAVEQALALTCLEADVSNEADVERVFDAALAAHGGVDAVVNNAAIGPLGSIVDTDPETWDRIMAVNLRGPYLMCRRAIVHMRERGGGRIVNVGSGAGWGKPNMAAYATSKGGLFTFSQALALDHFHDHINVNTVVPGGGGIESGMSLGRIVGDRSGFGSDALGTVAGRPATGEDIARAVAFLLSDDAAAISGTVVDVGCFSHQGGPPKARGN
jgi:NAD(P)-dependent dehydrogenase (short-subunit alcohol dehydrogenase family)